uniref:NADH-ubiquinone oxidoreductase chain 3 n=1 Tax=Septifer bilocularis TaxID=102393 RepID=A0A516EZL9_9BIVA|nr:NADH dehydrogenase subunit 3 [Septifer bilocularis]QDO71949.1 NADH dehydrogenase subunit 3 [Septifer bilocularis]
MSLFFVSFFIVILMALLWALFMFLSEKSLVSREKSSPYECGFEVVMSARAPFSLRFFILAVLFVVFDVEVALMVPVVFSISFAKSTFGLVSSVLFFFVLFIGLFHEYREGSLDWVS